jgi:HAD superfamily hydrolase (TIGR01509 family)
MTPNSFSEAGSHMKIEGVIFDSDGTLVDSETLSAHAISRILAEAGVTVTEDDILERFRGSRFALFAESLLRDYPVMNVEAFTQAFRVRSGELFAKDLKPMNGAEELVSSIRIEKCVASNGPRDKIDTCLGAAGLLPYFTGRIASAYEVQSWKPEPGLILHAASMMNVPPERCLLVEDSLAGVQAGLAAGVSVVGYRLSETARHALGTHVPVIQELAELRGFIG